MEDRRPLRPPRSPQRGVGTVGRLLALLSCLSFLCGPAFGQVQRSYGYVTLSVPAGWAAEETQAGLALYPGANPNVLILVMVDQGPVGDLAAFYAGAKQGFSENETLLEDTAPQPMQTGGETGLAGGWVARDAEGTSISRILAVLAPGGRGTALLYGSGDAALFEAEFPAFQAVLASLSFAPNMQTLLPAPQTATVPPAGSGGLSGLWAGTEQRMWFNASTGQMQTSWIDHYVYLAADGRFLLGVPLDWVNPDWVAECGKREAYACGTYSVTPGALLLLRQNDGGTRERFWKDEGTQVNGGGYYLWRANPAPAGFQLSGTFRASVMMPIGYLGTQTGFAVAGSEWSFTPDGRFRTVSGGGSSVVGLGGSSSVSEASGRYRIAGTTIVFTFDGGGSETASFFLWGTDGTLIDINGRKFSKAE